MTMEFKHLVDDWQQAYREFFDALGELPYAERRTSGVCGDWSAQQIVAHMAGWHQIALARFEAFEDGDTDDLSYDVDAVNAENVIARAHLDWSQTVAELRVRMAALYEFAQRQIVCSTASDPRYSEWLQGLADDARTHAAQITTWCAQKRAK